MAAKPTSGPTLVVVTNTVAFQFGTISVDSIPGTVVINPSSGTKTVSGSVVDLGGTHSAAEFEITGTKGDAITISLPASITLSGPTSTMTITSLTHDCADPCLIPTSGGGKLTLVVGGTLNASSYQAGGTYTGSFDLTADYVTNPQGGAGITDSSSINVTNIKAISVSSTGSMDFGAFYAPTSGGAGSVTIAPDGSRTASKATLAGGAPAAASFTVDGSANTAYSVTLTSPGTLSDGSGNSMSIGSFTHDNTDNSLPPSGSETLNVGATLSVPKNQPSGIYTGTFTVTVNYQ